MLLASIIFFVYTLTHISANIGLIWLNFSQIILLAHANRKTDVQYILFVSYFAQANTMTQYKIIMYLNGND